MCELWAGALEASEFLTAPLGGTLNPRLRCRAGLPPSPHRPVNQRLLLVVLSHWIFRWLVKKCDYSNSCLISIVRAVSLRSLFLFFNIFFFSREREKAHTNGRRGRGRGRLRISSRRRWVRSWYLGWDLNGGFITAAGAVMNPPGRENINMSRRMPRWALAWHVQRTERQHVRLDWASGWVGEWVRWAWRGIQGRPVYKGICRQE